MNSIKLLVASALIALSLAACHGGGTSIRSEATDDGANRTTGTVSPDMATNAPVPVASSLDTPHDSDTNESPLKSAPGEHENIAANTSDKTEPAVIEATGSYTNQATGQPGTTTADAPMPAALASDSGSLRVAIKPTSETVVQKAGPAVTSTIESDNNTSVSTTAKFTLAIDGIVAENAIKGLQFDIIIPDGISLRSNAASGATLSGIVTASPAITDAQPLIFSTFSPASSLLSFGLLTINGIGSGWLATIICDIPSGLPTPSATAFTVRNIKAVDGNGATISGVNVAIN
jgi:hypothetical protein